MEAPSVVRVVEIAEGSVCAGGKGMESVLYSVPRRWRIVCARRDRDWSCRSQFRSERTSNDQFLGEFSAIHNGPGVEAAACVMVWSQQGITSSDGFVREGSVRRLRGPRRNQKIIFSPTWISRGL